MPEEISKQLFNQQRPPFSNTSDKLQQSAVEFWNLEPGILKHSTKIGALPWLKTTSIFGAATLHQLTEAEQIDRQIDQLPIPKTF